MYDPFIVIKTIMGNILYMYDPFIVIKTIMGNILYPC
jgi:type III secretory pathway component EscR